MSRFPGEPSQHEARQVGLELPVPRRGERRCHGQHYACAAVLRGPHYSWQCALSGRGPPLRAARVGRRQLFSQERAGVLKNDCSNAFCCCLIIVQRTSRGAHGRAGGLCPAWPSEGGCFQSAGGSWPRDGGCFRPCAAGTSSREGGCLRAVGAVDRGGVLARCARC